MIQNMIEEKTNHIWYCIILYSCFYLKDDYICVSVCIDKKTLYYLYYMYKNIISAQTL